MSLAPRRHEGKHCFTYCGDDRCTCGKNNRFPVIPLSSRIKPKAKPVDPPSDPYDAAMDPLKKKE